MMGLGHWSKVWGFDLCEMERVRPMRLLGLAACVLVMAACATPSGAGGDQAPTQATASTSSSDVEPLASGSPTSRFTPIKLSGHGNKVPKFNVPEDAAAIAK